MRSWAIWTIAGLIGLLAGPNEVFAVAGGGCEPQTCDAPEPTCAQQTTSGTDNCGGSCTKEFYDYCQIADYPACESSVEGTRVCGESCTYTNYESCDSTPSDYRIWGVAMPGDPVYGLWYPDPETGEHIPLYPDPQTRDMLGLSAKGNIVVGDYLSEGFQTNVLPLLNPNNPGAKVQSYVVDPSDADLGYSSYVQDGQHVFNGDYTLVDANGSGQKLDGTPRRFYESSLPDEVFDQLMEPLYPQYWQVRGVGSIDAVLFTNHAFTGAVDDLGITGALVARDEALAVGDFSLNHDIRLLKNSALTDKLTLPMALKRPTLLRWEECAPSGCP
jgi:hypothetical protein